MKKSKLLTKGHKWELFVLDLSFFGWFLLIYLTFGIILFWVTPYYTMTKYYAFKALLEEYEKTTNEPINLSGTDETYSGTDDNPYFANDLPKTNEPEEKS